jgi:hypothetical protein
MILLIKVYENLIHGVGTCRWARTSYIPAAAWHKDVWNALYFQLRHDPEVDSELRTRNLLGDKGSPARDADNLIEPIV